ncbi:hypothetical protein BJY04DRAFT_204256 [Aspergillus karnatakaensis]|uniref:uncharacterized protein n=1 Tax=Aspergillus karnatakaensis TaxID=1810916 RepID=UPI003CCD45B0
MSQPIVGSQFAADVARILDSERVPNLLFGWLAFALVGEDMGFRLIDFVVNKNQLAATREVLERRIGIRPCDDPGCEELSVNRRQDILRNIRSMTFDKNVQEAWLDKTRVRPIAEFHYHIGMQDQDYDILSFHSRDHLLWSLDDIKLEAPAENDRNITLTTDHQLPRAHGCSGPWTQLNPIKILTQLAFTEAVMMLQARDRWQPDGLHVSWGYMLAHLYPQDTEIKNRICSTLRESWDHHCGRIPPGSSIAQATQRLHARLLAANNLPGYYQRTEGSF